MSEAAHVAAAGVRLRVHRRPARTGSAQPPLVLLHGAGDTGGTLLAAAAGPLQPAGGALLAPDLPGLGGSEDAGDLHPGAVAGSIAALVVGEAERLGWDGPLDVAGHDLGGLVGWALAAARPDLVRRLVMISAAPDHPKRHAAALGRYPRARGYAAALLSARPGAEPAPTPRRALVVWGSADRLLPQWIGEELTSRLARGAPAGAVSMAVLPGAGHRPQADAPGPAWAALAAFLAAS